MGKFIKFALNEPLNCVQLLEQRNACEDEKIKNFPKININLTTEYCNLASCILRKESKCYCDCRISDIVHNLRHLQLISPKLHFSSKVKTLLC